MQYKIVIKHFIAILFGFFFAFKIFATELVVYLIYQFFCEVVAIVFVNMPIEKFYFSNPRACFIKNPAQSCFFFLVL